MADDLEAGARRIVAIVEGDEVEPDPRAQASEAATIDFAIVEKCAQCYQSDTGNSERLLLHFGADLATLATEGGRSSQFIVWTGTHWDADHGDDAAVTVAKRMGPRIVAEADFISASPAEREVLDSAEKLSARDGKTLTGAEKATIREADDIRDKVRGLRISRRKFGVSSSNAGRIDNMLRLAAPEIARAPDDWNPQALIVATATHTLRFYREPDPECPDPDVTRLVGAVKAIAGHRRTDWITRLAPVAYDPTASAPLFTAFIERFLPDPDVRRMVQCFTGLGLTGIPIQKLMFHYGVGANGKSVFLETVARVLGHLSVNLPTESIAGDNQRGGQNASPDLARLHGARMVRIPEIKQGETLNIELIKKLTGGEKIPVRNLFKGFFDFQPQFKAHMSGNGYPRIEQVDNGTWRRIAVVKWPVVLGESEQRDFEDVVSEMVAEGPGILNWLIAGVLDYLTNGLFTVAGVAEETAEMRNELDPVGQFIRDCVIIEPPDPASPPHERCRVKAREMFEAYRRWCATNSVQPYHETRFGRLMKSRVERADGRVRYYLDCRLVGVDELDPLPQGRGT